MKDDKSLRLTALYAWGGLVIVILLILQFAEVSVFERSLCIFTILFGLAVVLILNLPYWLIDRRPSPEKNLLQFLIRCNESELSTYISQIRKEYPQEIDLTVSTDKGSAKIVATLRNGLVYDIVGILKNRRLTLGDILLLQTSSGEISRFIIVDLTYLKEMVPDIFLCHAALIH